MPTRSSARKNREAYTGRLRLALAVGKTANAQTIAAEITQLWPDDAAARNQNAYLQLLLGASDGVAEAAERDAEVLVERGRATRGPSDTWPGASSSGSDQGCAGGNPRSSGDRQRTAGRASSARPSWP